MSGAKKPLLDFDIGEILAEDISYSLDAGAATDIYGLMFVFVTYHRSGCGGVSGAASDARYRDVLRPVDVLPPAAYPRLERLEARPVALEVLEVKNYSTDMRIDGKMWSRLVSDGERHDRCKELMRPEYTGSPWLAFTQDATRKNRAWQGAGFQLCEFDAIWLGRYRSDPGAVANTMSIEKYSPGGDLLYKIRFPTPDEPGGYLGAIVATSFLAEHGYLFFEWWNAGSQRDTRLLKRRMKVRLEEG